MWWRAQWSQWIAEGVWGASSWHQAFSLIALGRQCGEEWEMKLTNTLRPPSSLWLGGIVFFLLFNSQILYKYIQKNHSWESSFCEIHLIDWTQQKWICNVMWWQLTKPTRTGQGMRWGKSVVVSKTELPNCIFKTVEIKTPRAASGAIRLLLHNHWPHWLSLQPYYNQYCIYHILPHTCMHTNIASNIACHKCDTEHIHAGTEVIKSLSAGDSLRQ